MHIIRKRIDMCYGHRLMDYAGKCAHPHGHNGRIEVDLAADTLDGQGMVCDFNEVKEKLKAFIDGRLDHRMVLREDDPLVGALAGIGEEPFVMKENPTAENIAGLIFREARARGLPVLAVRIWETPTSMAEYREDRSGGGGD